MSMKCVDENGNIENIAYEGVTLVDEMEGLKAKKNSRKIWVGIFVCQIQAEGGMRENGWVEGVKMSKTQEIPNFDYENSLCNSRVILWGEIGWWGWTKNMKKN